MTKKCILFIILSLSNGAFASLVTQPAQDDTKRLVKEFTDAAYTNKLEKVVDLLKSGIDINSKGPGGQTALQRAASQGHVQMVELLINNGANPNIADNQNITPLIAAVMSYPSYQKLDAVQAIIKMLIAKGATLDAVNAGGQTALMLAIATELFLVAEILLNEGATIWPKNIYHQAASDLIDEQTMRRLEKKIASAQTDEEKKTAEHEADIMVRIKGNETTVKAFLAAASANERAKVEQLLNQGVRISSKDGQGDTALHYAAMQGHREMAAFLLQRGADIEQKDLLGMTPLQIAARSGQFEMVVFLLTQGANPSTLDKQNYNPLITAIKGYSKHKKLQALTSIVEILLEKGDNINQQNKDGQTALIYASILDLENIVQMLVDVGADTTIKDQLQHSALDVTKSDKIRDILKSTDSSKQKRKAEAHKELLEYLKQADVYETEKLKEKHRLEELQRRQEFEEQQQADLLRLQEEQRLEQEEARTREQNLPQALNQLRQALGGLQRAMPRRSLFDEDGTVKKHQ